MESSHIIKMIEYMETSEKQNKSLTELSNEELLEIIFRKDSLERALRRELKKKEENLLMKMKILIISMVKRDIPELISLQRVLKKELS